MYLGLFLVSKSQITNPNNHKPYNRYHVLKAAKKKDFSKSKTTTCYDLLRTPIIIVRIKDMPTLVLKDGHLHALSSICSFCWLLGFVIWLILTFFSGVFVLMLGAKIQITSPNNHKPYRVPPVRAMFGTISCTQNHTICFNCQKTKFKLFRSY